MSVFNALMDDQPLLSSLRTENIKPADLREEAQRIRDAEPRHGTISPGQPAMVQTRQIEGLRPPSPLPMLLSQLAEELELTDRDVAHSVILIKQGRSEQQFVRIQHRQELNIPEDVPILFIDADVQPQILNLFRPDTPIVEISVERLAEVYQFDLTFSKTKLLAADSPLLAEARDFIRRVSEAGQTLVVTNKEVRLRLTGEMDSGLPVIGQLGQTSIIHFQRLRGLNDFSNYDNVIILGREQPPAEGMEEQAMALWWDAPEAIETLPEQSGNHPFLHEYRGYRMRDGSPKDVKVQIHPDLRVQTLLEQTREAECAQGIDRLRLVRKRGEQDEAVRRVFLLMSIPLDITVDHLSAWGNIQKVLKLWDRSEGVLPLGEADLLGCFPDAGLTSKSVRTIRETVRNALSLIYFIISNRAFLVRYKIDPHARAKPYLALMASDGPPQKADLERVLGYTVGFFEILEA